jgi:hypothetical protein
LLFNSFDQLTVELAEWDETFPNLRTLNLEMYSTIENAQTFLANIVSIFPALDYLNLEGDWSDVSKNTFVKLVRNSEDQNLMIMTEEYIFADEDMTLRELADRKTDNQVWDLADHETQDIVPC